MQQLQQNTCRVCDSSIEPRSWGGGECEVCGSVSVNTIPTEEELDAFYQSFNKDYTGGGNAATNNLMRYARRYLQIVRQYAQRGKLIDVGSSSSPFPNLAARAGFDVTAMDYVRPEHLNEQVEFICGNLNDDSILTDQAGGYDIVTSWAVMEHVPNPKLATKILATMCRPGGMIFLMTPEIGTFLTNHALGRSGWFCPPEHLHLISADGIEKLFTPLGCQLTRCSRLELNPIRFAARYGQGVAEAMLGLPLKMCSQSKWQTLRDNKKHKFHGISVYVLKRNLL